MSLFKFSVESKRRLKIVAGAAGLVAGTLLYFKYFNTEDQECSNIKSSCCSQKSSCCATEQKSSCCADKKLSTSSCCGSNKKAPDFKSIVHSRYSATARNFETTFSAKEQEKLRAVAKVFGYTPDELEEIGDANMGLSCGNPVRQAKLKKGEVVLDLGCGAGMDLFLAKALIGDSKDGGELLGVDFSQDMLDKAVTNAQKKKERKNMDITNMKFMRSDIEDMKAVVKDDYVDCVISNCVMNLLPNKLKAFKDVYRVLKPNGGRVCLSDIAFKKEFPFKELKEDITAFVNCVSGGILATEYEGMLYEAGFKGVKMVDKKVDLNVWKSCWGTMVAGGSDSGGGGCCPVPADTKDKSVSCCGGNSDASGSGNGTGLSEERKEHVRKMQKILGEIDLNDYVASYYVFAYK